MVYPGFLRIGGTEVVNTERARGYVETTDCPKWLLQDKNPCDSLQDALDDEVYDYANIPQAPWYDLSLPDVSGRFYGVVGLGFRNLLDSSRSASLTEGTSAGGTIGRMRKGAKQPRVRATLLSRGDDAMEYGLAWLNSAFDGNCSSHGDACGVTDMEFLADCPPARADVPDFTPWVTPRTNLMVNPKPPVFAGSGWTGAGVGSITADGVTTTLSSLTTPYQFTAPAAGGAVLGHVYAIRAKIKASMTAGSAATNFLIRPHKRTGNVYFPTTPNVTVIADGLTHEVAFYWTATANIANNDGFELSAVGNGSANAGSILSITDVLIEDVGTTVPTTPPGEFFYGDTPDPVDLLTQYLWAGAVNNSASYMQARAITDRPQTDAEYAVVVDRYRRFMHEVSVTSGPLVVEERTTMDGEFRVMTVEWTISAERPWIYSLTRPVELPISPTAVVQDTPYNLAPYPSAELATAGAIDVAINHSANPSLETNATNWATTAAVLTGTAPAAYFTSGRVTGELAANGTASMRGRILGNGATEVASSQARIITEHTVTFTPGSQRVSFTGWAASLIVGGAGVSSVNVMRAEAQWYVGATPTGAAVDLGTATVAQLSGRVFALKSQVPPAGATSVRVRFIFDVTWRSSATPANNSDIRVYSDAVGVTVP